ASVVVRGPLQPSEAHNAADPKTVDPIAAALGADRPTWHEHEAAVAATDGKDGAAATGSEDEDAAGPADPADRA
ncbi:MAG: hypothetical protein ACHQRO_13570, partial [Vicinamibacteria bacterium]